MDELGRASIAWLLVRPHCPELPVTRFAAALFGVLLLWPGSLRAQDAAARYQQACDGGDAAACTVLGLMYERGAGVGQDPVRAARLLRRGLRAR